MWNFSSGKEKIENSNSIDPKCMHPIVDQASSDVSSPNKNCSDKTTGAILPTLGTSKQPGGPLLNQNEINVCFIKLKLNRNIGTLRYASNPLQTVLHLILDLFNIQFTADNIYYNESGIPERTPSSCSISYITSWKEDKKLSNQIGLVKDWLLGWNKILKLKFKLQYYQTTI